MMYKKTRPESKNMIIGIRPVIEAIEAGKSIDKLFIQRGIKNPQIAELMKCVTEHKIFINRVPQEKLHRLTKKVHQGVVCFISPVEYVSLENLVPQLFESGKIPLILILDRVTDVRNFGAITRSAECFGVDAVVIPQTESAQVNEDAVKSSAGAIFNVSICKEGNLLDAVNHLKDCGYSIVSCTEKSNEGFENVDFCSPTALILGSEGEGISSQLLKLSDKKVAIPITGKTASLNVSVAAGIALFEVNRFRTLNNC
ncbi:MAG: 23S rRNA (guanosine(2251)-2'-O)-methyltransferase RlmB [Bacteroidia bacterium]|nr:23S rRNA (guanosine(2251)-2'-O)-methyltransferase RlmB [Bacteroidia bacterium]